MNPFSRGDAVIYRPDGRLLSINVMSEFGALRQGETYTVMATVGEYVVLRGFSDGPGIGLHHDAFAAPAYDHQFQRNRSCLAAFRFSQEYIDSEMGKDDIVGVFGFIKGEELGNIGHALIEHLIETKLSRIGLRNPLTILYRDGNEGDYWELSYPDMTPGPTHMQRLARLSPQAVLNLYGNIATA